MNGVPPPPCALASIHFMTLVFAGVQFTSTPLSQPQLTLFDLKFNPLGCCGQIHVSLVCQTAEPNGRWYSTLNRWAHTHSYLPRAFNDGITISWVSKVAAYNYRVSRSFFFACIKSIFLFFHFFYSPIGQSKKKKNLNVYSVRIHPRTASVLRNFISTVARESASSFF